MGVTRQGGQDVSRVERLARGQCARAPSTTVKEADQPLDEDRGSDGVDVASRSRDAAGPGTGVQHDVDDELLGRAPVVVHRRGGWGGRVVQVVERCRVASALMPPSKRLPHAAGWARQPP